MKKPNSSYFKSGHVPWNKEKKGLHLSPASEFKKGSRPINWCPVGTIRVRLDKHTKTQRNWIKIQEPKTWIELAKHVWLKSGRKLIKGLCLHHKNNRSDDDRLSNLMLVTRQEHPKLHNHKNTKN
jgi:hypothetical protein